MSGVAQLRREPAAFSPTLWAEDAEADYWLRQATLRLRRETAWRWHLAERPGSPRAGDRLMESLDFTRYADEKRAFCAEDVTARYLAEQMRPSPRAIEGEPPRGGFAWAARTLALDDAARLALGIALLAGLDSAAGPVIAGCHGDGSRMLPTLGLVQRLWDRPEEVSALADPQHPLWRLGLLRPAGQPGTALDWETPFSCPPLVARRLAFPGTPLPEAFAAIEPDPGSGPALPETELALVAGRLRPPARRLRVVPLRGRPGAAHGEVARAIGAALGREVRRLRHAGPAAGPDADGQLPSLAAAAWLAGADLLVEDLPAGDGHRMAPPLLALASLPATLYVPVAAMAELDGLPPDLVLPPVDIPPLTHAARLRCWRHHLGPRAGDLEPAIGEVARRFRYEPRTIAAICAGLPAGPLTAETLAAAARAQVPLDTGDLAQAVTPRFRDEELVLPPAQRRQVEEIHNAMRRLAEVHYGWGTARAWNEGGISVLFAGPSGTGKTMAAEVLAARLAMPMYRIDLSQVVNKYIGETEKNLKRLFDVADVADAILFFDEADALFGRRTEVRDAHDRYANLEVSYLLERMERFKGLAILATNRRKDLDEAFLRRLRYIVEFPLPDVPQRRAIWERVIPPEVDAGDLDLDFLARQFQLTGGSIRSIVFNACLQSAAGPGGDARRLAMPEVLVAVKRECEKLGRGVSPEQFGPWLAAVEALRDG